MEVQKRVAPFYKISANSQLNSSHVWFVGRSFLREVMLNVMKWYTQGRGFLVHFVQSSFHRNTVEICMKRLTGFSKLDLLTTFLHEY